MLKVPYQYHCRQGIPAFVKRSPSLSDVAHTSASPRQPGVVTYIAGTDERERERERMDISWAFGNANLSDIQVVLTTEQPEACRKRLGGMPAVKRLNSGDDAAQPALAAADSVVDPSSSEATQPSCEVIRAHKLVLLGNSEYFKALERWGHDEEDDVPQPDGRKRKREGEDQTSVAVVSLPDDSWFNTAKDMLRFMYTQRLDEGMGRLALLQLLQLGDQYGMAHLRCACLQQLARCPVAQWPAPDKEALFKVAAIISNDTSAGGDLAPAAAALISSIAAGFTTLEEAWRSEELREEFCSLPHAAVLKVLSCDDLVVRSENTALVAALSWLRACGKDAPQEQRREVLLQVRLRQLSRCFLAWLFAYVPEFHDLVPAATRFAAVLHLGARDADCGAKSPLGALAKRKGADANLTVELKATVEKAALLDAVAACRAGGAQVDFTSAPVRYNGLVLRATVSVWRDAAGKRVKFWVGSVASVEVGAAASEAGPENGFDELTYRYTVSLGTHYPSLAATEKHPKRHHYGHFVAVNDNADVAEALKGFVDAQGRMVVVVSMLE
jgi:hypothetical protein